MPGQVKNRGGIESQPRPVIQLGRLPRTEPEQTAAVREGGGELLQVSRPRRRGGHDQDRPDVLVAVGVPNEASAQQFQVALQLLYQAGVSAPDIGADHLKVERQCVPAGRRAEGAGSVGHNALGSG